MANRIAILGAGSWGMALADLLVAGDNSVRLWEYSPADYEILIKHRGNPNRLTSFRLPSSVAITHDVHEAVTGVDYIVLSTPSQHVRAVVNAVSDRLRNTRGVINVAKGIETGTLKRISEIVIEEGTCPPDRVATLSGPSHAEEVILDIPTTVVAASQSESFAQETQQLFSLRQFRVYASQDLIGVELGGSLKNIIAIAAGIADGLRMGDNTKGALITRGLAEITRLGVIAGAKPETFAGLSGLGDLVTTCTSRYSRNRMVGERVAQGQKLADILADMNMVAEGVDTTRSAHELARRKGVEMPITNEIYSVLFEGKAASDAVVDLMGRELKAEIWR